ncbi:hypothetical protein ACVXG7_17265 [Enterobacter hormaechei]
MNRQRFLRRYKAQIKQSISRGHQQTLGDRRRQRRIRLHPQR